MSLLSYTRLCELIEEGVIDAPFENVNSSSIDITLGDVIMVEARIPRATVCLKSKETPAMVKSKIPEIGILLPAGSFMLGSSRETFNLPNNISAEYKLNSSLARSGLDHLNAGWCDAGWHGSRLTLEFKNCLRYHELLLNVGMKAGQIVFWGHEEVPKEKSYARRGQYNGDDGVQASKGLRTNPVDIRQPQPERRKLYKDY